MPHFSLRKRAGELPGEEEYPFPAPITVPRMLRWTAGIFPTPGLRDEPGRSLPLGTLCSGGVPQPGLCPLKQTPHKNSGFLHLCLERTGSPAAHIFSYSVSVGIQPAWSWCGGMGRSGNCLWAVLLGSCGSGRALAVGLECSVLSGTHLQPKEAREGSQVTPKMSP